MRDVVEEALDDEVLLHHVQRQVERLGGRPRDGRPEDDGQVGRVHAVVLAVLGDLDEVLQQELERVVVLRRQRLQQFCSSPNAQSSSTSTSTKKNELC